MKKISAAGLISGFEFAQKESEMFVVDVSINQTSSVRSEMFDISPLAGLDW